MPKLTAGDIFEVKGHTILGDLSKYGITPCTPETLSEGHYYVLGETANKEKYIVSNVEYLKGGFYTLGKANIFHIPKEELLNITPIDQVPLAEIKEVLLFLKTMNN